jgi:hypothetical protein
MFLDLITIPQNSLLPFLLFVIGKATLKQFPLDLDEVGKHVILPKIVLLDE